MAASELPTVVVDADGAGVLFAGFTRPRRSARAVVYVERSWLFDASGDVVAIAETPRQALF